MVYVRPSNVSNVIGTELASAAVSGTGSNAPEELSKLERDWARIVGRKTELSDLVACPPIFLEKAFQGKKSPACFSVFFPLGSALLCSEHVN